MQAYYDYVGSHGGAFRLVFESDLTSEAAVRSRVDQANQECAEIVDWNAAWRPALPNELRSLLLE